MLRRKKTFVPEASLIANIVKKTHMFLNRVKVISSDQGQLKPIP